MARQLGRVAIRAALRRHKRAQARSFSGALVKRSAWPLAWGTIGARAGSMPYRGGGPCLPAPGSSRPAGTIVRRIGTAVVYRSLRYVGSMRKAGHPAIQRQGFQTGASIVVGDESVEQAGVARRGKSLNSGPPIQGSHETAAESVQQPGAGMGFGYVRSGAGPRRRLLR